MDPRKIPRLAQLAGERRGGPGAFDPHGFPVDLNRPIINGMTEHTITVESDGKHINFPTILDGKKVSDEEAINLGFASMEEGMRYPSFNTREEAEKAAEMRSEYIGRMRYNELNR